MTVWGTEADGAEDNENVFVLRYMNMFNVGGGVGSQKIWIGVCIMSGGVSLLLYLLLRYLIYI